MIEATISNSGGRSWPGGGGGGGGGKGGGAGGKESSRTVSIDSTGG